MATNIIGTEMLYRQYAAAMDMLDAALRDCPDELWEARLWGDPADAWIAAGGSSFWYVGYHTLFWLDLYLGGTAEGFAPPPPFDLAELDPQGRVTRVYTRAELLAYLDHCRAKCRERVLGMSGEEAVRVCRFPWGELAFAELQLDNLRHVQEHGAQLRMLLGQQAGRSARWAARGAG